LVANIKGIAINSFFHKFYHNRVFQIFGKIQITIMHLEIFDTLSFGKNICRRCLEPGASKSACQIPKGDLNGNILI